MNSVLLSEQDIIKVIQDFDVYYQRSDDPKVFAEGNATWNLIQRMYNSLSVEDKIQTDIILKKRNIPIPVKFKPKKRNSPVLKPFLSKDEINRKFNRIIKKKK